MKENGMFSDKHHGRPEEGLGLLYLTRRLTPCLYLGEFRLTILPQYKSAAGNQPKQPQRLDALSIRVSQVVL